MLLAKKLSGNTVEHIFGRTRYKTQYKCCPNLDTRRHISHLGLKPSVGLFLFEPATQIFYADDEHFSSILATRRTTPTEIEHDRLQYCIFVALIRLEEIRHTAQNKKDICKKFGEIQKSTVLPLGIEFARHATVSCEKQKISLSRKYSLSVKINFVCCASWAISTRQMQTASCASKQV